jgi:hypothetical protein
MTDKATLVDRSALRFNQGAIIVLIALVPLQGRVQNPALRKIQRQLSQP